MRGMTLAVDRRRVGLVLAGGAARGAYEAGVLQYLLCEVPRALGRPVPLDVLCGTSVGAINVCALAAWADEPEGRAARLVRAWTELRLAEVLRPDFREIVAMVGGLAGHAPTRMPHEGRRGGVLEATPLEQLLQKAIPFERIQGNLRAGRLHALSVSTTHVKSGRTVVFIQRREPGLPRWREDPTILPREVRMRESHALASGAIPFLFPAVRIDGEFYCDGGLRQNVPLSPARRLGADGLIVVNPRYIGAPAHRAPSPPIEPYPGPLFLLGKALNAILLDRIDADIDRLDRINRILDAGTRRYGADFVRDINDALGDDPGKGMRPLRAVLIRASQDIGELAATFVRSPEFRERAHGMTARLLRRLGEGEGPSGGDLLSYLLFDGAFAQKLIDLGWHDARARREELCTLLDSLMSGGAPAS
jgi:NTE family protein